METRGARSARAEAKETQADIVARASDQWRDRRRERHRRDSEIRGADEIN